MHEQEQDIEDIESLDPVQSEERGVGSNTEISINLGEFSNKRKVSSFSGICSTWGFYHYRTFDGGVYTFPSTCWYNLVESAPSSDDFISISVKSVCEGLQCSRVIGIQHNNIRYEGYTFLLMIEVQ
ncbi:otogelin-like protein [Trichonephila clavipes]|nr:otogelin-like protein [Trichonephila clavipes]